MEVVCLSKRHNKRHQQDPSWQPLLFVSGAEKQRGETSAANKDLDCENETREGRDGCLDGSCNRDVRHSKTLAGKA